MAGKAKKRRMERERREGEELKKIIMHRLRERVAAKKETMITMAKLIDARLKEEAASDPIISGYTKKPRPASSPSENTPSMTSE
jgi:hypothetical protein